MARLAVVAVRHPHQSHQRSHRAEPQPLSRRVGLSPKQDRLARVAGSHPEAPAVQHRAVTPEPRPWRQVRGRYAPIAG